MKKTLLLLLIFFSCDILKDDKQEGAEILVNKPADITISESQVEKTVLLAHIFSVKDKTNEVVTISIKNNSNPDIVTLTLKSTSLKIQLKPGKTGKSNVKLIGSYSGQSAESNFTIHIIETSNDTLKINGESFFKKSDYKLADDFFSELVKRLPNSTNTSLLAHTQLKQEKFSAAVVNFDKSLSLDSTNLNALSGKMLLAYSHESDFDELLKLSSKIVSLDQNYQFYLDISLNIKDVLLHKALAHFELKQFLLCYQTLKSLDNQLILDSTDSHFEFILAEKIAEYIKRYN